MTGEKTRSNLSLVSHHKDSVTIYDVAREAGVSPATVSRVINKQGNVSPKTADLVNKAIKGCHFVPNQIARTLHLRLSRTIGLIVQSMNTPYFTSFCQELENICETKGYVLIIGITGNDPKRESLLLQNFVKRQVDGFILLGGRGNNQHPSHQFLEEIKPLSEKFPLVFVNGGFSLPHCFHVKTDEAGGFRLIVEHLIQRGHRNFMLLTGQRDLWTTEVKIQQFYKTLEENKIPRENTCLVSGEYTFESGRNLINEHFSRKQKSTATAIVCTNDILALGAIDASRRLGLSITGDLCVSGFDDIPMARYAYPSLTTLAHPFKKLAQEALQIIIDYPHKSISEKTINIGGKLIIRESTDKPIR